MTNSHGTRAGMRSERMYEALVVALYPKRFRQHYAREMRLAFRQLCRDAYARSGAPGLVSTWVRELPTLVAGAIWERNLVMARTVMATGSAGAFKATTRANATVLILFGCALFLAATDLLLAYGFVEPTHVPGPDAPDQAWAMLLPAKLMTQTLGVTLIGVGALLFAAIARLGASRPGALGTGLPGALAGTHALLALAFVTNLVQYPTVLGWVTMSLATAFTVTYAAFWFAETMSRHAQVSTR